MKFYMIRSIVQILDLIKNYQFKKMDMYPCTPIPLSGEVFWNKLYQYTTRFRFKLLHLLPEEDIYWDN